MMGFQIEFLHLNVMKSEEVNKETGPDVENGSIKEKKLDRILDCEHNYLVLPEKKALALGEGRKRSWVWKYFEKLSNYVFRCNVCSAALSIKGCNTNNMNRHVRSKHPDIYKMETGKRYCSEQVSDIGSEVEIPELNWPEDCDESKNGGKEYIICVCGPPLLGDSRLQYTSRNSATLHCLQMVQCAGKTLLDPSFSPSFLFYAIATLRNYLHSEVKRRKPKPRSWIWDYFTRVSGTLAQCKICSRNICHGGNATGNMNRHMKMLHKDVYVNYVLVAGDDGNITKAEEEWAWIWKLFSNDEDDYYKCKICMFKLAKSEDINNSVDSILHHLKSEHGVVSHDQIITSVECDNTVDECTVAVDFLKDSEDI
ncbi:hypothetical protein EVAR_9200_1 [Eumeta japonica]|uniref:BED-type domain-containing protein n=1 Tax=Eumeta variegata TaxID=151549 RepID=A0A4C1WLI3_EUMVA|nr:hypothetical protein EVAR_9200_1 [Eumeta japonica]